MLRFAIRLIPLLAELMMGSMSVLAARLPDGTISADSDEKILKEQSKLFECFFREATSASNETNLRYALEIRCQCLC